MFFVTSIKFVSQNQRMLENVNYGGEKNKKKHFKLNAMNSMDWH